MTSERTKPRFSRSIVIAYPAAAVLLALAPHAAAQEPTWLREFGGPDDDGAVALLVQPGRVLMAGATYSSLFGPNMGAEDAFLAWFDDAGTGIGGAQFGTSAAEFAHALAAAPDGGVFVTGATGGSLGAPNAGGADAWVARRDGAGVSVWVRQLGTPEFEWGRAVCPDGEGGVFVTGETLGSLGAASGGWFDCWVARYDAEGQRTWLIQFGTPESDIPTGIVADGAGGFFIAGSTMGSLGGPLVGITDAWIARFGANGAQMWVRQIGTPQVDTGRALASDGVGGVFWVGSTEGAIAAPNAGWWDVWVARYDTRGTQVSLMQFGSPQGDEADAVCADSSGGAIVAGNTTGSLGAPGAGLADAWIARIQGGTTIDWIDQFGSPAHDAATAVAATGTTLFVAGYTYGNLAPGGGGFGDAWLARYDLCYPDCNGDGVLTIPDFGCYQTRFVATDMYADCNADGLLTVADFGCFQTKFVVGCP